MQGVKQIKKTDLNPMYVFIHPPSRDELEKRLRGRKTETEESLQKRLAAADAEMAYGTSDNFDKVVFPISIIFLSCTNCKMKWFIACWDPSKRV